MKTQFFSRKTGFCLLLILITLCLPRLAFAQLYMLQPTTWGSCSVSIDTYGALWIKPETSGDCTIETSYSSCPWNSLRSSIKSVNVQDGTTVFFTITDAGQASLFQGFTLCDDWSGLASMDVSGVKYTENMFNGSTSLKSTDLQHIQDWDVSNVLSMQSMFYGCTGLTNVDYLVNWKDKVTKVDSMYRMFYECENLENVDGLLGWTTSVLRNMDDMFSGCTKLNNLSGLDGWTTSGVQTMNNLFENCISLTSDDLSGIGSWVVSGAGNMESVFAGCSGLTNLDHLSGWDVSGAIDIQGMFENCSGLTNIDGIKDWNVSNVEVMPYLFAACTGLTNLNLSGWDLSKVTSNPVAFTGVPAGLPLQIRQYYPALDTNNGYPTTPYVYGKHSYRDFENAATNGLTENPAGWTFEPCTLTISFNGGTYTVTQGTYTDAEDYYTKVKVFTNNISKYDIHGLYYKAGDTVTLTLTPNDPSAVIESVKATTTTAAGSSTTVDLTAPYSFTITGDTTVVVTLQGSAAPITVDVKGGIGDTSVFDNAHVGDTIILPALTKENYQFVGWDVNGDGVKDYAAGDPYTVPSTPVTLTAIFSDLTGTYTITYERGDAESGTVPAPQTGIAAEASVTLAGNVGGLGKEGHEFSSWTDGLNTYMPGSAFLMPAENVTLWPVFVKVADPLPEDEIGTYYLNEDGVKEYIQFHNYDICMMYMGDDNLCRNTSANLYNY